jgi:hypothetical protein
VNEGCDKRAVGVVSAGKRKGAEGKQGVVIFSRTATGAITAETS